MKYPTYTNKLPAAVALLSRFNWFDVSSEDTTGKTAHFCATGIDFDKFGFVWFNRQFATPKSIENSIIDVIAESDNRFLFIDRIGTVYTVEASNKDLADCSTASGSKDDPASLIDWHRSGITEDGGIVVVLDLRKMGHISNMENSRIKYFMSAFLGGLAIKPFITVIAKPHTYCQYWHGTRLKRSLIRVTLIQVNCIDVFMLTHEMV